MRNPVLIELTRGALVESLHAGAVAVVRADGEIVAAVGDVAAPTFPRSAIKPLQAIPLVETGAADRFGFGPPEIALASASHSGTQAHTALARSMLGRAGLSPDALACGVHAVHKGEPTDGYWRPDHPVQVRIARVLEELAGCRLSPDVCGTDGCSVPNWAMPLNGLAQALARLAMREGMSAARAVACRRIAEACAAHPDLVAGPGRLDTLVMARLPGTVLMKAGAEGVYCGALPERGLGFALKIDDGAKRAAEAVVVQLIGRFYPEIADLGPAAQLTNWRGVEVGRMRPSAAFEAMLERLQ